MSILVHVPVPGEPLDTIGQLYPGSETLARQIYKQHDGLSHPIILTCVEIGPLGLSMLSCWPQSLLEDRRKAAWIQGAYRMQIALTRKWHSASALTVTRLARVRCQLKGGTITRFSDPAFPPSAKTDNNNNMAPLTNARASVVCPLMHFLCLC